MAFRIAPSEAPVKAPPVKRPSYLSWIRTLPCVVTGTRPVEAAHLSMARPDMGHYGKGKSQKASDSWCLPLCPDEHRRQHDIGEKKYWFLQHQDPHTLCLVLWRLWSDYGSSATEHAERIIMKGIRQ